MSRLYMLAFEHRSTFRKLVFGHTDPLSSAEREHLIALKRIIFQGVRQAATVAPEGLAISVDDEYGEEIHREAHRLGILTALPIERSGRAVFEFEHADWQERLRFIRPHYAKALIRVAPESLQAVELDRLRELNDFCHEQGMRFLLEPLIVPAAGESGERFERETRPRRFEQVAAKLKEAGILPDTWKLEGSRFVDVLEDHLRVVMTASRGHPQMLISGRSGSAETVAEWLRVAAPLKGVCGFALGRSVFGEPIKALAVHRLDEAEAVDQIAQNLLGFIECYRQAAPV